MLPRHYFQLVITGLDPVIHGAPQKPAVWLGVDARIKSRHDDRAENDMLTLILIRLVRAWRVHATRRTLGRLDAHRLRDLALTQEEVAHERAKPFWRR